MLISDQAKDSVKNCVEGGDCIVSLAAVFSIVTQRSSPQILTRLSFSFYQKHSIG